MDTIRLLLPLENTQHIDVIQYYITCAFMRNPSFDNLIKLSQLLDHEISSTDQLSAEQLDCVRYLYRDWGYCHLGEKLTKSQEKKLFTIDGTAHAPGHFLAAIDFAKLNPKDNISLMRFGLMLLTHSALKDHLTLPKIQAIEQLLANTEQMPNCTYHNPNSYKKVITLVIYNSLVFSYSLWLLFHTNFILS